MNEPSFSNRIAFMLLLASVGTIVTGCGDGRPSRVKVSGHVTIDGKPLKSGGVSFKPVGGGRAAGGQLDDNGQYSTTMYKLNDGLPLGSYKVAVTGAQVVNDKTTRWHAPMAYSDHQTSGLTAEITEETATLDFDLTWEVDDKHSKPWNQTF